MKHTETINLSYTQFNDKDIRFINTITNQKNTKKFSKLKEFKIKGCWQITKKGISDFCNITAFDDNFNIQSIFELPHLLDFNVIKDLSNSKYMKNVIMLDFKHYSCNDINKSIA